MSNWFDTLVSSDIPAAWEEILQQQVPIYRFLSEPDRRELRAYIGWFIETKRFEGCAGLVITDEIRVTVAAHACLLLLHRETPCYQGLRSIHIYPGGYFHQSSAQTALGESWEHGVVLLAWNAVRGGAANPFDGYNVALHEFAHQLDHEDGKTDGTPVLGKGMAPAERTGVYATWAKILASELKDLQHSIQQGHKTVMDAYGSSNAAEFFAVATECFFEKPRHLRQKHPELYTALREFYRQDPAAWPSYPTGHGDTLPPQRKSELASPPLKPNIPIY